MKKVLSFIIAVAMVATVCVLFASGASAGNDSLVYDAWDGTADTAWFDAAQTSFEIDTAEKLAGLAKLANEYEGSDKKDPGAFVGKTFYVTANLDLTGYQWVSIGISNNIAFAGMLEGKLGGVEGSAVTIKGLSMGTEAAPTTVKNIGLVGTQGAGGIKNIYLVDAYINTSANTAGSFVGYSRPQKTGAACEYSNLRSDATIITTAAEWCGGIVAYSNIAGNTYKNCVFTGSITTDNTALTKVGGLTGHANTSTVFENCYVSGEINTNAKRVGGFVGEINAGTTVSFTNCQYDGTLACTTTQAGSFVGRVSTGATPTAVEFINCFNSGISKSSYTPLSAATSWVGLCGGYVDSSDAAAAYACSFTFTGCYSLADIPLLARIDYIADKANTVYTVKVGANETQQAANAFDMLASLRPTVLSYSNIAGNAATTSMQSLTFSETGWATRTDMYPVLSCALEVADNEYGEADMSWFKADQSVFSIETENQLVGLRKIVKVYDFADVTITAASNLHSKLDGMFSADFVQKLKNIEVPVTTTEEDTTTEAPADDTTTATPDDGTTASDEPVVTTKEPTPDSTTTVPQTGDSGTSCGSVSILGILLAFVPTAALLFFKKRK